MGEAASGKGEEEDKVDPDIYATKAPKMVRSLKPSGEATKVKEEEVSDEVKTALAELKSTADSSADEEGEAYAVIYDEESESAAVVPASVLDDEEFSGMKVLYKTSKNEAKDDDDEEDDEDEKKGKKDDKGKKPFPGAAPPFKAKKDEQVKDDDEEDDEEDED